MTRRAAADWRRRRCRCRRRCRVRSSGARSRGALVACLALSWCLGRRRAGSCGVRSGCVLGAVRPSRPRAAKAVSAERWLGGEAARSSPLRAPVAIDLCLPCRPPASIIFSAFTPVKTQPTRRRAFALDKFGNFSRFSRAFCSNSTFADGNYWAGAPRMRQARRANVIVYRSMKVARRQRPTGRTQLPQIINNDKALLTG